MSVTAGDIRANMTLDANPFSQGVYQAVSSLETITNTGQSVTNAMDHLEARAGASGTGVAQAMQHAGASGQSLMELAAKAEQANARLAEAQARAQDAAAALNTAQAAAEQSAAALQLLEESAAASADNLKWAVDALDRLKSSGTATYDEIANAEKAVNRFSRECDELNNKVNEARAAHEANNTAVEAAQIRYQKLAAQLAGAEAASEKANGKLGALTETLNKGDDSVFGSIVSELGSSTLTSASRSLGTMAANAAGLASNTAQGTLAATGLSTTLRMLTRSLGGAGAGFIGMAAAAAFSVYEIARANDGSLHLQERLQELISDSANENYTAALNNVDLELNDEDGIKSRLREKIDHIFTTLTDGEADTPEIIENLTLETNSEYSSLSAQVDQYFTKAIESAETTEAQAALKTQWENIQSSLSAGELATLQFINTYAGQSTEVCKAALDEIEAIYARVQGLVDGISLSKQLLDGQYGDAYRKTSGGYYATEQDITWSLEYIQANRVNAEARANEEYETALKALNDAFDGKDGTAKLGIAYEVDGVTQLRSGTQDELTKLIEDDFKGAMDGAQAEMETQWGLMIHGLLRSGSLGADTEETAEALRQQLRLKEGLEKMLADGGADLSEVLGANADLNFVSQVATALGKNPFKLMDLLDSYVQLEDYDGANTVLQSWLTSLETAAEANIETLKNSGLGALFASAIEAGIFDGLEELDSDNINEYLALMLGDSEIDPYDITPWTVKPEVEVQPEVDTEEVVLPSPEELIAQMDKDPNAAGPAQIEHELTLTPNIQIAPASSNGLVAAVEAMQADAQTPLSGIQSDFASAGNNAGSSFAGKLAGWASQAAAAATAIGSAAYNALKASLGINSPSKMFSGAGDNAGSSFANSLSKWRTSAATQGRNIGDAAYGALRQSFAMGINENLSAGEVGMRSLIGMSSRASAPISNTYNTSKPQITVNATVRNDNDIRKLTREIGSLMGSQNYGMR